MAQQVSSIPDLGPAQRDRRNRAFNVGHQLGCKLVTYLIHSCGPPGGHPFVANCMPRRMPPPEGERDVGTIQSRREECWDRDATSGKRL